LAHLDRWLDARGLRADQLSGDVVDLYCQTRRAEGHRAYFSSRGCAPVLNYLREAGAVPIPTPPVGVEPIDQILASFQRHLSELCKLATATVDDYEYYGRLFLSELPETVVRDLSQLNAAHVMSVVRSRCRSRSYSWVKNFTAAARSLLRFLFLEGYATGDLIEAVLPVTGYRHRELPEALDPDEVEQLYASCARNTPSGRRDLAVLTLALRLGLRAAELAALELGDVDWRAGEVIIRGKGGRRDRLPLPRDVGEVIVDYLRCGRDSTSAREVFLTVVAPRKAISSKTVEGIVRRASRRAGLADMGPHRLRHTAASSMLRAGVSLPDIGQVLRHEHVETTAGYARVDRPSLATLAMPWPRAAR
jgi:site-specific recombinase XerD